MHIFKYAVSKHLQGDAQAGDPDRVVVVATHATTCYTYPSLFEYIHTDVYLHIYACIITHLEGDAKPGNPDRVAAVAKQETDLLHMPRSLSLYIYIYIYAYTYIYI